MTSDAGRASSKASAKSKVSAKSKASAKAFHERFADWLSKQDVREIVRSKCAPSPGCMA